LGLQERVLSGLSSGEGIIWAVRDPIYKAVRKRGQGNHTDATDEALTDPGTEDKRLFVAETEFSQALRVMSRQTNTLSAVLRNAWDCGSLSTLSKNSPARASGAHVSVCGHITEEELFRELAECEFFNGFANRFLWVCVRRSKLLAEAAAPEQGALRPHLEALRRALTRRSEAFEVRRKPAARELWAQIYEDLSEEGHGRAGAVTDRAEAQVLRLSLLYALADASETVDGAAPERGLGALALLRGKRLPALWEQGDRSQGAEGLGCPPASTRWAQPHRDQRPGVQPERIGSGNPSSAEAAAGSRVCSFIAGSDRRTDRRALVLHQARVRIKRKKLPSFVY
jgi:hypothetical protein